MNISETFQKLAAAYPERRPGSQATQTVFDSIKSETATTAWEYKAKSQKIKTYSFSVSMMFFLIGSLLTTGLSFIHPLGGVIIEAILLLLFISELVHPRLAKIKPQASENLICTIPARSKELQRLLITTSVVTDSFNVRPSQIINRVFLGLIYGLGLIVFLMLLGTLWLKSQLPLYLALFALLVMIILKLWSKDQVHPAGLSNCSILLELGAILMKTRPSTTTVTLFFSGANSLNSGILELPKLLKEGPDLSYLVNLESYPDKRINLVTADGLVFPQQSDPLLIELLMEAAKEKDIPVQAIKLSEISPTYALKWRKLKVAALTSPSEGTADAKNIRELLIGLIRKLDH
ncbi:MAG TPA: hypothetical protein DDW65_05735 [Firmicutes bacterium]|nr:hypothetical protein [Bacillota bacterium]